MRQEIEVAYEQLNGSQFRGSITPQEAKHIVFKHCLKFKDYSNFDGVRCGYKGAPVSIFRLKRAINVDELMPLQHFDFRRKITRQGTHHVDIISCKIRGIRHPDHQGQGQRTEPKHNHQENLQDDGTRRIKIEGCEYRIPKETLTEFLGQYGEILTPFSEELFKDGVNGDGPNDGTNRTGNYLVTIRLKKQITQFLPILGRRIKIIYPGIQRQCTNCFGNHSKQNCQSQKMTWPIYVRKFIEFNQEIPKHLFGKWHQTEQSQPGTAAGLFDNVQQTSKDVNGAPISQTKAATSRANSDPIKNLNVTLPNMQTVKETENWVRRHGLDVHDQINQPTASTQENIQENDTEPRASHFLIPSNPIEHDRVIDRMV